MSMKIKNVKVVDYKEAGINFDTLEEVYENGTGKEMDQQFLEMGFIRFMFESIDSLDELEHLKDLDNGVLVQF